MIQVGDLMARLNSSHVPGIPEEDQRIVVLRFVGWSADQIATHFFKHPRTVHVRIEHVVRTFCARAGVEYEAVYLMTFVQGHALCGHGCLAAGVAYAESLPQPRTRDPRCERTQ